MTYPVVVFAIAVLAVLGMLLFIVPVFAGLFDDLGGTLPLPTRVLVFLSGALKLLLPVFIVGGIAGSVVWRKVKRTPQVRNVVDPLKLQACRSSASCSRRSPSAASPATSGRCCSAACRSCRASRSSARTAGNVVIERASQAIMDSVRRGESLAAPLTEHSVFPPMVVQMIAVGEDTGALDNMLHKISDFYDQEVEATTEALTALIEPLMIAFMGAVIGSMIVALYMPIFSIFNLIQE